MAYTNIYTVSDTHSRADVHAIPDLHTMAYVDTDTGTYCYCGTDADTDCDCAYTDTGSDCYGDTYADSDCNVANTDPCADGYGSTDTDTNSGAEFKSLAPHPDAHFGSRRRLAPRHHEPHASRSRAAREAVPTGLEAARIRGMFTLRCHRPPTLREPASLTPSVVPSTFS